MYESLCGPRNEPEELKGILHKLTPAEAKRRIDHLRAKSAGDPPPSRQDKIDHFVVVFMENHAFDNMLGCFDLPGIDGIPPEGLVIEKSRGNASAGTVTLKCGTAGYICPKGPGYSLFDLQFKENPYYYPYSEQNYNNSHANGAQGEAINLFSKEQLPVKYSIAKEFGLFSECGTDRL